MKGHELRSIEVFNALAELDGKVSIYKMRDHLKSRGLLSLDEDVINQYELDLTRRANQLYRNHLQKKGDVKRQLVHLTEETKDGKKVDYFRKYGECTISEVAQHLTYRHKRAEYEQDVLMAFAAPAIEKFGFEKLQRELKFALPVPVA